MDIHKPKPWQGWRELAKEIGTIVIGVLIALAAEQGVEWLHWRHKVDLAETAIHKELAIDLSYAVEQQALSPCAHRYIDALQRAVAENRPQTIAALHKLGIPLDAHPWRVDTWTAALNAQVPDHLPADRLGQYSLVFRFAAAERDQQWEIWDLYPEALSGRFGRLADPGVAHDQLKLADRLRADEDRRDDVTQAFIREVRALGVAPDQSRATEFRARTQACEAGLKEISLP